jgi:hypothetical protein
VTASEAIKLVVERKKPSPEWTNTNGIYADLSKWPEEVSYYAECPKCKQVHGNFKSMVDAHRNRHCTHCSVDNVDKIKDEIFKVLWEPEKKIKPIAQLVGEAEDLPPELPPELPPDPGYDPEDDIDPKADVLRLLAGNWVMRAVRQLEIEINDKLEIDDEHNTWYGADYDPNDPEAATAVYVKVVGTAAHDEDYIIFKDDDTAHAAAVEQVKRDYDDEPNIFSMDLLEQFVDEDRLKNTIGDHYEDWGDEERQLDYEDKLDKMVDEYRIEPDDPIFFKKNGGKRTENRDRKRQLDEIVDSWANDTKPEADPWAWLKDCYGDEEAKKWAVEHAGIDVDKMAEYVVQSDGWQNTIAIYNHNSITLKDGIAARLN